MTAPTLEDACPEIKALADALSTANNPDMELTMPELTEIAIGHLADFHGYEITGGSDLTPAECLEASLSANGYTSTEGVDEASEWCLLDVADFAYQILEAHGYEWVRA